MGDLSLAKRSDLHIARKLWHVFCGCAAIGVYFVSGYEMEFWGYVALATALVGFALDFARLKNEKFNKLALKVFGKVMRQSEKENFSGLPFYALGIFFSIFFYSDDIALLSILFLVFADPAASFFGVSFGTDKILPNKSLQGTIACFFVCYFISMLYVIEVPTDSLNILAFSILAAIAGSLSELFSAFNIDDNLTMPVLSGAGITLINYFFGIL